MKALLIPILFCTCFLSEVNAQSFTSKLASGQQALHATIGTSSQAKRTKTALLLGGGVGRTSLAVNGNNSRDVEKATFSNGNVNLFNASIEFSFGGNQSFLSYIADFGYYGYYLEGSYSDVYYQGSQVDGEFKLGSTQLRLGHSLVYKHPSKNSTHLLFRLGGSLNVRLNNKNELKRTIVSSGVPYGKDLAFGRTDPTPLAVQLGPGIGYKRFMFYLLYERSQGMASIVSNNTVLAHGTIRILGGR